MSAESDREDVATIMGLVWELVRSGPNYDGRGLDVQRAVAEAIDNAVAEELKRTDFYKRRCEALQLVQDKMCDPEFWRTVSTQAMNGEVKP